MILFIWLLLGIIILKLTFSDPPLVESYLSGVSTPDLSVLVNLFVAIATLALACATFWSVRSSKHYVEILEKQLVISNKELELKMLSIEKPRALEHLYGVINPLCAELRREIKHINNQNIVWKLYPKRDEALDFPISSHMYFYDNSNGSEPDSLSIEELGSVYPSVIQLLKDRHITYANINVQLSEFEKKLNDENFDTNLTTLIHQMGHVTEWPMDENGDYFEHYVTFYDCYDPEKGEQPDFIPLWMFKENLKNMIITDSLSPLRPEDPRFNLDHYGQLICEYHRYKRIFRTSPEWKEALAAPQIKRSKCKISDHIQKLLVIDTELLQKVETIRKDYLFKYKLTESEANNQTFHFPQ